MILCLLDFMKKIYIIFENVLKAILCKIELFKIVENLRFIEKRAKRVARIGHLIISFWCRREGGERHHRMTARLYPSRRARNNSFHARYVCYQVS